MDIELVLHLAQSKVLQKEQLLEQRLDWCLEQSLEIGCIDPVSNSRHIVLARMGLEIN